MVDQLKQVRRLVGVSITLVEDFIPRNRLYTNFGGSRLGHPGIFISISISRPCFQKALSVAILQVGRHLLEVMRGMQDVMVS